MGVLGHLITVSAMLSVAFFAGRLQSHRIPSVVAYLFVGAALGPGGARLVGAGDVAAAQPVTAFALSVLMFAIGERLSRAEVRAVRAVVPVVVAQAVTSAVVVYAGVRMAGADQSLALVLAALAGGGAPLTVASIVRSLNADAPGASRLVTSHALADATAAGMFGLAYPLAVLLSADHTIGDSAWRFLRLGVASVVLGVLVALSLSWVVRRFDRPAVLCAVTAAHLVVATALSSSVRLSLPLTALTMGAVVASSTPARSYRRLLQANQIPQAALSVVFFTIAGTWIQPGLLAKVGGIGAAYVVGRAACKLGVGFIGARRAGLDPMEAAHFGLNSLPQAGAAVALAVFANHRLPAYGIPTIILGSIAVFEVVGCLTTTWSVNRFGRRSAVRSTIETAAAPP